jgi:SAM-dependent methyltransferase
MDALGDARSVVNIGAGAGSYEPRDREVIAVEPSRTMIEQRPPDAAPALQGGAEALPLPDASVDSALAILTVHHWSDLASAFSEIRRVARRRAVFLTWDPEEGGFWLTREYFPSIERLDRLRCPSGFVRAPRPDKNVRRPHPVRLLGRFSRRVLATA